MFKHLRPVWAEINLDNVAHNMEQIRRMSNSKEIIAVVKADAYGHGALDTAPVLLENGATSLAVAVVSEGVELRRGGIECPIMVLGFTPPSLMDYLLKYDIQQTVYSYNYAKELSDLAKKKHKKARIHIAIDTGMGRIGFMPNDESLNDILLISKLPDLEISGIFSHFSTADEEDKEYSKNQLEKFEKFYEALTKAGVHIGIRHMGNSAVVMEMPEAHFEAVRPGIILYGYYPSKEVDQNRIKIKPVMELKTNIAHIKKVPSGYYISYGRKFRAAKESIIVTLPVGYADGYTRLLFNKAKVIINGQFAPVVGNICMDQCMVDVTEIKGEIMVGDEVILIGEEGDAHISVEDIADMIGTINYEVVCMITKRVPRVYIKDGKVVKVRNYV